MQVTFFENETIAAKALRLLEQVPEDKWLLGMYTNRLDKCCVLGHYKRLTSDNPNDYSEENCIYKNGGLKDISILFLLSRMNGHFPDISWVNDGHASQLYPQPNAKTRSMALLKDMVKAGY